jgi:NAD(P)-dependent dehydrogenase (short-subunit alcohol dehydrogenase family)
MMTILIMVTAMLRLMDRLKGKVALITGSGSGIGRANAVLFAREGAKVAVSDVDVNGGNATVAAIEADGGVASFFRCDVTNAVEVKATIDAIIAKNGRIDVVHSHVGGDLSGTDTVVDDSEEDWDKLMALNIKSHFLVTKHVIPAMIKNGGGSIIITITTNAFMNYRHAQAYGTTKSALIQLTKSLAMDYAEKNIRVNALAPGEVLTPMWERHFNSLPNPAEAKEAVRRKIPIGRIATPEEVASCALFLASDDSRYVTGNVIFVDGGLMAGFYDSTL